MVVHHGQFMKCPKCGTVYLVSDLVGGATVWHLEDDGELLFLASVADEDECTLAQVFFHRERNRLEVHPGSGVV